MALVVSLIKFTGAAAAHLGPIKVNAVLDPVTAPEDAPQTQYLSAGDPASDKEAAGVALAAYAAAEAAGAGVIPPAAIAKLIPASTV